MTSAWMTLKDSLNAAPEAKRTSAKERLMASLRRGEIEARAEHTREFTLTAITYDIQDLEPPFEFPWEITGTRGPSFYDFAALGVGEHQVIVDGHHRTALRKENSVTLVWHTATSFQRSHKELSPIFWQTAVADFTASAASSNDVHAWIRTEASGVMLNRDDVHRIWKIPGPIPLKANPGKSKGGRPPGYDWYEALIEMGRIAYHDGLPPTQAALEDRIKDWFEERLPEERMGEIPGDTQIREYVGRFYRALRSET